MIRYCFNRMLLTCFIALLYRLNALESTTEMTGLRDDALHSVVASAMNSFFFFVKSIKFLMGYLTSRARLHVYF